MAQMKPSGFQNPRSAAISFLLCAFVGFAPEASAQIGGQSTAPAIIDNAEDLNLNAGGVNRDWISDFNDEGIALTAIGPGAASLTLASGQTPNGVLRLKATGDGAGFLEISCGVPVPSVASESTASHPGNMTPFENLSFAACVDPTAANLELQVILECYPQNPDTSFPKLNWFVTPAQGITFAPVTVNLRTPDLVDDAGTNTVEQLLSQTRFLAFYVFAGPDLGADEINLYFDDIMLTAANASCDTWMLYD
jgi:hypothetical protein